MATEKRERVDVRTVEEEVLICDCCEQEIDQDHHRLEVNPELSFQRRNSIGTQVERHYSWEELKRRRHRISGRSIATSERTLHLCATCYDILFVDVDEG